MSSQKISWFVVFGAASAVALTAFCAWLKYLLLHLVDAGPGTLVRGIPFILDWLWRFIFLDIAFVAGIIFWLLISRGPNDK